MWFVTSCVNWKCVWVLTLQKKKKFNFGYNKLPLGVNECVMGLNSFPGGIPASVDSRSIVALTRINHLLKMNE